MACKNAQPAELRECGRDVCLVWRQCGRGTVERRKACSHDTARALEWWLGHGVVRHAEAVRTIRVGGVTMMEAIERWLPSENQRVWGLSKLPKTLNL